MKTKNGALFLTVLTVLLAAMLLFEGCTANEASTGNDPLANNNENGQGENGGGGKKPPVEKPPVGEPPVEEPCTCLDEDKEVELDENGYPVLKPICEELIKKINEDGINFYYANLPIVGLISLRVLDFFGIYNSSVVFVDDWNFGAKLTIFIDGISFTAIGHITVWKEGEFYTLEEAYELGLLEKNDLEKIAYYCSHGGYFRYQFNIITGKMEAIKIEKKG